MADHDSSVFDGSDQAGKQPYLETWRPIASAPEDRAVLIWDRRTGAPRVAQLCTAIEDGETAWVYARRLSWEGEPALAFIAGDPTHWMPLPLPPAAPSIRQDAGSVTDETDTTTRTPVVTDEPEG